MITADVNAMYFIIIYQIYHAHHRFRQSSENQPLLQLEASALSPPAGIFIHRSTIGFDQNNKDQSSVSSLSPSIFSARIILMRGPRVLRTSFSMKGGRTVPVAVLTEPDNRFIINPNFRMIRSTTAVKRLIQSGRKVFELDGSALPAILHP
jgi:hypothetical protein